MRIRLLYRQVAIILSQFGPLTHILCSYLQLLSDLIDARRVSDNQVVCIKRLEDDHNELKIALMFSSEATRRHTTNHVVPIQDHFQDDEDEAISYVVIPFLRAIDDPPFETVDDIVQFCDQILEASLRYV